MADTSPTKLLNLIDEVSVVNHANCNDETPLNLDFKSLQLDLVDITESDVHAQDDSIDDSGDEQDKYYYQEPMLKRDDASTDYNSKSKFEQASYQTIIMQPELQLLKQEKQREKDKLALPKEQHPSGTLTEHQLLLRRFPWMAESLNKALADLENESALKGSGKMRSRLNKQETNGTAGQRSLLRNRKKQRRTSAVLRNTDEDNEDKPKVVFSRNIPLLMYNKEAKKCIHIGGNKPTENDSLESIYRAINFNPELKRITLDIDDLRFPEKEKPLQLALSYISANTLHNPFVISDDMCKFSHKKELMIRYIVAEIEKRLSRHRDQREQREERQRKQDEEIQQQKEEEELRGRDIITAKRLLEQSKKVDETILTKFEKKQERNRRIRLRTKSMPTDQRVDVKVKARQLAEIHV